MLGFFSFVFSDIVLIAQMGVLAGLGTLIAFVSTYLFLGPLLVLAPMRARGRAAEVDHVDGASVRARRASRWVLGRRVPVPRHLRRPGGRRVGSADLSCGPART